MTEAVYVIGAAGSERVKIGRNVDLVEGEDAEVVHGAAIGVVQGDPHLTLPRDRPLAATGHQETDHDLFLVGIV
jgi:hypothetical protein